MCENKAICILCLTASDQVIHLFENDGHKLDAGGIISKHFWIQPNKEAPNAKAICLDCWNPLYAFHEFYESVEAAHHKLRNTEPLTDKELKSEGDSDADIFVPCTDFLTTEIKVEAPECDPFSEVEVKIDTSTAIADSDSDSEIPIATLAQRVKSESKKSIGHSDVHNAQPKLSPSLNAAGNDDTIECGTNKKKEKLKNVHTRKAKENKKRKVDSDGEKVGVKRRNVDPVKIMEQSREFDEIIKKNMKLCCSICNLPLSNFYLLRKHFQSKHNERGYATCCGKKFRKRGVLVDHINLHLNPEYFKCEKCNRVLADRSSLEMHMITHDTNKERIYKCETCSKSFFRKLLLDRHMYTHIPGRDFSCEYCEKLFSSEHTLKRHISNVHNLAYRKICEQCGKSFRGPEAFGRHQLEHSGLPLPMVECEICGVKLTTKYGLKGHMESMHPETEVLHICKVCGKESPSEAALKRHIIYMHKSERSHKCPMCDKAFKLQRVLVEHMTTHTGESLYTCPHCPKTFNSRANMHSHRKKMHRKEWEENRRYPHQSSQMNKCE